jgi:hypothetical protein
MTRTGLPVFTGITTYQDQDGRFKFRHPSDWDRDELAEDRDGVIVRPEPDDDDTYFAVWIQALDIVVAADDLPELRDGLDAGMAQLPEAVVTPLREDTYGNIVKVERSVDFVEAGVTRRRKVWGLYADKWQLLVTYQGSTVDEYEYWLPMANYCYNTFELPEALWFATDPEVNPQLQQQKKE